MGSVRADVASGEAGSDAGPITDAGMSWTNCSGNNGTLLNGAWHHVAGVVSSTGMRVYLDGVEICNNGDTTPVAHDVGPNFFVGRHGAGNEDFDFDGNIDDVRVYNRVLTPSEVAAVAQGRYPP
jgi:hypothetical protein